MRIAVALCCAALLAGSASSIDARQAQGTAHTRGQTGLAIRIDPQVASLVRAWRAAHGLDAPADAVTSDQARHTAQVLWKQQCHLQGGASAVQNEDGEQQRSFCT